MPQISKIRIVNFRYNDGNRFIPDELYDLTSFETGEVLNTLFNLYNGGGKTVLVQLMMQPVHPKAMAGGRRIEDYFVRSGDHSFVLLEWKLDESRNKLLIGIALAASTSNSADETQRGNHIRYYTFKTVYEDDSQYSIESLELSKNDNGKYVPVPFDYIREKAKASRGVLEYYSSDDSVKWAKMLSEEYGIHRMEWETVIEALNKDEGGLNQYFNEAKTSDRLISKFFIPAIEHKQSSAASKRTDSSLETMLINYAKKITDKENVIQEKDTNSRLLDDLSEINEIVEKLSSINEELSANVAKVCSFKAALSKRISKIKSEIESIAMEADKKNELIRHIRYEKCSKEYYIAEERYEKTKTALAEITAFLDYCNKELKAKNHEADILRCAKLYDDIITAEAKIKELKKLIYNKENNSEDAERIASLKFSVFIKAQDTKKTQVNKAAELTAQLYKEKDALKEYDAAKKKAEATLETAKVNYNKAESNLAVAKKNTDKRLDSLGIALVRKFDGFYSADEVDTEKDERINRLKQLETEKNETESLVRQAEIQKDKIPEEKADIRIKQNSISDNLVKYKKDLAEFDFLYERLKTVCDYYSLSDIAVFSDLLRDSIHKDIDITEADLITAKNTRQELEDKKAAAEKGCLHILPEIMRYVESTGVSCITGEEYLSRLIEDNSISYDAAGKILSDYPEIAYSLLFYTNKDLQNLLSAGNTSWLPALVPLFTMEQVEHILDGSMERSTFLSACDSSYFEDKKGYISSIDEKITSIDDKIARRTEYLDQAKIYRELAKRFNYPESWRTQHENLISSSEQKLMTYDNNLCDLDKEAARLDSALSEHKEKLRVITTEMHKINSWLDSFTELEGMLSDEIKLYNKEQSEYFVLQNAKADYKKACDGYESHKANSDSLEDQLENINRDLERTRDIVAVVSGAKEASVINGELEVLYSQYNFHLSNMSKNLEGLRNSLLSEQENLNKAKKELLTYRCDEEEYKTISYSSEQLLKIKNECNRLENDREKYQKDYDEKNREYGSAEEGYRRAKEALADYDNIPLPKDKIGDDFKARIKETDLDIKNLTDKKEKLNNEKNSLESLSNQVSNLSEEIITEPAGSIVALELESNPTSQCKILSTELRNCITSYANMKHKLTDRLKETVLEYKETALTEIIGKLNSIIEMIKDTEVNSTRLFTVRESIGAMIASIKKINSKIETDLREIENDFNDIVEQCFIQGKRIYTDLRMIAASSKAHIYEDKPQIQMVKMDLPDEKEISEEASRVSIRNEIKQGANELRDMLKNGSEDILILKLAKSIVSSECLLHKYIRRESISVKVYKIDLNRTNSSYKRWEDTLTQISGAEKFVVFFSVILTLMNYTRSSAGLKNRNTNSVLILDNPFGKITSAHLLKPMFDIAKHFNVQLICLSDINKSDVISCFECVIKLVIKMQSLSNYEIMTHEGNESIEHGYYKIVNRQQSLF